MKPVNVFVRVISAPVMVPLLWLFVWATPNKDPEEHPITFWQFAWDYVTAGGKP